MRLMLRLLRETTRNPVRSLNQLQENHQSQNQKNLNKVNHHLLQGSHQALKIHHLQTQGSLQPHQLNQGRHQLLQLSQMNRLALQLNLKIHQKLGLKIERSRKRNQENDLHLDHHHQKIAYLCLLLSRKER